MQPMPSYRLRGSDLQAIRGERCLFSHLNFSIENGQVLQVVGPNGVGKTSLLRLVCGLLPPTQGEILWCDNPIEVQREAYHKSITFIGHQAGFRYGMSAMENLKMDSVLSSPVPTAVIHKALRKLGLSLFADIPVGQFSAGQKKRLALCRLLLSTSVFWILDEPFSNLDGDAHQLLLGLIEQHVGQGGMVMLTCHQFLEFSDLTIERLNLG